MLLLQAENAASELRNAVQKLEEAKREKDELLWAQDRHVQDAERARNEAAQLRQVLPELNPKP
jgi:hypothetical protein